MSTNATGLKPEETKALKERSIHTHEQPVREVYANDAIFHDPVGLAKGPKSIEAQFIGLAKVSSSLLLQALMIVTASDFPSGRDPKLQVVENPPSVMPNTILIDQDVSYYRNPRTFPTKVRPHIWWGSPLYQLAARPLILFLPSHLMIQTRFRPALRNGITINQHPRTMDFWAC